MFVGRKASGRRVCKSEATLGYEYPYYLALLLGNTSSVRTDERPQALRTSPIHFLALLSVPFNIVSKKENKPLSIHFENLQGHLHIA